VEWGAPTDSGGSPVTGYVIYLDTQVFYNSSEGESMLSEYTLTSLTVARTYAIAVSARNRIGEGPASSVSLLAVSKPPKLAMLDFQSATSTSITVNATAPSYSGGSPITAFAYRRDDGPLTAF
jgi:large repetitive protein